ncbi:hypothetical protein GMORB2_6889 [Geosmithia morbida]|uniref:TUG ubiquitin-like domain-containing protein n=1 Tax=Geosmithia morbida TaxID=1094350 RepID=A0A9P5D0C3_9HYPO|nr:uncharacterized protein GMORB2_6889 [Geosmithia morbida]KAF4122583.1 hypothetical protein GMORB2_6889 [Geosmithia morbida]
MSSHVVVISTDLRRTTVKVTPGTYLADVLQQACTKLGLPGDKYLVKHKQKQVDLTIPFRASGLSPGAKLELVQKSNTPSAIQVALQLPQPEAKEIPGGRLVKKFPSDLTLWQVLRQFESGDANAGRNINITARGVARIDAGAGGSGQLYYETPVLNIMGREISTFTDLQKTLASLGYNSGNVLIRLTYKTTDQTLHAAMDEISQLFKEEERGNTASSGTQKTDPAPQQPTPSKETNAPDTPMADAEPAPAPPQEQEQTQISQADGAVAAASSAPSSNDPYSPVNVYLAPSGTTPAAALTPASETDFTPTVAHAQLHQARLLENAKNKRLLSDRELDEKAAAEEAKISAVKSVRVKVRFPDNTSSEWDVGPSHTGAFLYAAVRHIMAKSDEPFHLALPGGKSVIKDRDDRGPEDTLVRGYKMSGRVLVNLVWDEGASADARKQPFLKSHVASQGQTVKVPEVPQIAEDEVEAPAVAQVHEDGKKKSSGEGGAKKVPKWLKLGKK